MTPEQLLVSANISMKYKNQGHVDQYLNAYVNARGIGWDEPTIEVVEDVLGIPVRVMRKGDEYHGILVRKYNGVFGPYLGAVMP